MKKLIASIILTSLVLTPAKLEKAQTVEQVNNTSIELTLDNNFTPPIVTIEEKKENEKVYIESSIRYYKTTTALNKRQTPSTDLPPIGWLGKNEPVKSVKQLDSGWVELSDGSFVNGKYLTQQKFTEDQYLQSVNNYKEMVKKQAEEQAKALATKNKQKTVQVSSSNVSVARGNIQLSASELDLLARLVRAEAGGESYEGMVAVASVVFNRVESSRFPNTVTNVIYAHNQFSPVSNGSINKPASDIHYKAVKDAMTRDNVNGALFFYAPSLVKSPYMESLKTVTVIGVHVFKI